MEHQYLPPALVLSWNSRSLRVKCPYCLGSHTHEPGEQLEPWALECRWAPCGNGKHELNEGYCVVYPPTFYKGEHIGWEYDKDYKRCVAVTRQGRMPDPEDDISPLRKKLQEHSRQGFVSDSDSDSLDDITQGLDKIMIAGSDQEIADEKFGAMADRDGSTAAHLAVYSNAGRIALLIELRKGGFDLDKKDHYGRTPLMEASLRGYKDTVRYLVRCGAHVYSRDANGMNALDFSEPTRRNEHERIKRGVETDSPQADVDRARRIINEYLRIRMKAPDTSAATEQTFDDHFIFVKDSLGNVSPYRRTALYKSPYSKSNKAFGLLNRGLAYRVVSAMSGFSTSSHSDSRQLEVLDNGVWTEEAEKLCEKVGHPIYGSFASHAEKQLIAFYAKRHLRPIDSVPQSHGKWMPWDPEPPPLHIAVNKEHACSDCALFIERFQNLYRVPVNLSYGGTFDGTRLSMVSR